MKKTICYSLDTIDEVVDILLTKMKSCSVFTFEGPLGAGKTTLIKRILARCGVKDVVTSPTFTYIVPYTNEKQQTFYHFDLYRLSTLKEFRQAGFDEYLYQPDSWAFIEWPAIVKPLLANAVCHISLEYHSESDRLMTLICSC